MTTTQLDVETHKKLCKTCYDFEVNLSRIEKKVGWSGLEPVTVPYTHTLWKRSNQIRHEPASSIIFDTVRLNVYFDLKGEV